MKSSAHELGGRWKRALRTPVWTLLRGRVEPIKPTGRRAMRQLLAESGLPSAAAALVGRVVRRTRLWPGERREVAEELIAHFADGLEAGAGCDELVRDFGDEAVAARLIRRGKKRNRPLWWQVQRRAQQGLMVLLAVYVGLWGWLLIGRPVPTTDYLALLNAPARTVAEGDRAWPIYREAMIAAGFTTLDTNVLWDRGNMVRPGNEGWLAAAALLREHAALLDGIRLGASKPGLGLEMGFDRDFTGDDRLALFGPDAALPERPSPRSYAAQLNREWVINLHLPHLGHMRTMARLLVTDMHLALEEGDAARFVSNHAAAVGLARQVREVALHINQLVGISILAMANEELSQTLFDQPEALNDEQWQAIAHHLAETLSLAQVDFSGEQIVFADFVQRFYSPSGRITRHGMNQLVFYRGYFFVDILDSDMDDDIGNWTGARLMMLPVASLLIAGRDDMSREAARLHALMRESAHTPLRKLLQGPTAYKQAWEDRARSGWMMGARYSLLLTMLPRTDDMVMAGAQVRAVTEALQAAIALELYRRREGVYPQSLDQLVPRYLPGVSIDHSTGGPLRYRLVEGRPLLYGLGLDGEDHGGVVADPTHTVWPRVPEEPGTDWVLWPRPRPEVAGNP